MGFDEYFDKICALCIVNDGEAWSSYVEPNYRVLLKRNDLLPSVVEDEELTMENVGEMLKLEVERRHTITGRSRALANWVYEIIDGTIEPAIETGESELINKVIDLLQKDKATKNGLPAGFSFAKKTIS